MKVEKRSTRTHREETAQQAIKHEQLAGGGMGLAAQIGGSADGLHRLAAHAAKLAGTARRWQRPPGCQTGACAGGCTPASDGTAAGRVKLGLGWTLQTGGGTLRS